ncbi:MAG: hypothetical protein AAF497_28070 [Planctomycetota bacterium]
MKVIFFTQDLMFSGRIASAASAAGAELEEVMNAEVLLDSAANGCDLVILDLATSSVVASLQDVVPKLKSLEQPPTVLAYGPHVQESNLELARESGCDQVMSRGQFNSSLGQLFTN